MSATIDRSPQLSPPIATRVSRPLAFVACALVPLSMLVVPLWIFADGATLDWSAALAMVLTSATVVLFGAGAAWLADRVDGARSTEAKRRRSVVLGAGVTALLTVIASAFTGSAISALSHGVADGLAGNVVLGTLLGGSVSLWLAPILALPAAALGTVLVGRSAGVRDSALLVLLAWIAGVSLIGATADPFAPRVWAMGVIAATGLVFVATAFGSLRRLFWAIRLVCTPHRFWRLEVTGAHPDTLADLPRLASSDRSVVLMLRDDSAGGPFRGADAFHPVAVLPASAATWVISTLARATVAVSLAATTVALSLTSL